MTALAVRPPSAPPLAGAVHWLVQHLCTSNPFYVISAGLFLAGLYASFEAPAGEIDTWALLSGLAGYTLLLAVTAFLLVRFASAWHDLRTVLLLVVLFFLATSVTFDEVLVLEPARGTACYLIGLAFAVLVSEGLLRGIRLRLPVRFRVPYHLILALFFLYPLFLRTLLDRHAAFGPRADAPRHEALLWALFAFSGVAGLIFLTLLPAIRRGAEYVRDNGSPWQWPLYPWTLFGLLAFAVPARAFLLCWSMHLLNNGDRDRVIFGPYFLVPFGLAIALLLLEIGLVAHHRRVQRIALALPVGLVALAIFGHRSDAIYREFLDLFIAQLGATPLFLTLLAVIAFYGYAALRGVRVAVWHLTTALAALAFFAPDSLTLGHFVTPSPLPLLAAAALQVGLGLARRNAWNCVLGGAGLAAAVAMAMPDELRLLRGPIALHLSILAMLVVGAAFRDDAGRFLRAAGAGFAFLACLVVSLGGLTMPAWQMPSWMAVYPPVMAALLACYGWLLYHDRASYAFAGGIMAIWLVTAGWRSYLALRQLVTGLDPMVLSLAVFIVAILISLGKSVALMHWLVARGWIQATGDDGEEIPVVRPPSPPPAPLAGQPPS
jgi:hypothetical protein